MMKEIWKDVLGYEGHYKVSNLGRVKSLKKGGEKILSQINTGRGYKYISLSKNGKIKRKYVHVLVAESFLGFVKKSKKIVVDHINNISDDNRLENLQILTQRQNINKDVKSSSKYDGVYYNKSQRKYLSHLRVNGKEFHLGTFPNEVRAGIAYQFAILQLNNLEKILA